MSRRRSARIGFTLVEVIVALGLLGGTVLALAGFMARYTKSAGASRLQMTASDLAVERIESAVRLQPTYASIDGLKESAVPVPDPEFAGFRRTTTVVRKIGTGVDTADYRVVTVTVAHPRLPAPVNKTVVVPAF